MVPINWLSDKHKVVSCVNNPISDVKYPNVDGTVPDNLFLHKCAQLCQVNDDLLFGMVPVNWLLYKVKVSSLAGQSIATQM